MISRISLFAVLLFVGCNFAPFPVEMVEGIVTLDGEPLEDVTVSFSPEQETSGMPAVGRTKDDGRYVLTATQGGKYGQGTSVGKYVVSLRKDRLAREPTTQELAALEGGASLNIPIVSAIPSRYNDPKTSGLTVEVVKGKNRFDFELKSE